MLNRDFLLHLHPTSLQSLVSSSGVADGISNHGLQQSGRQSRAEEETAVYCGLTEPIQPEPQRPRQHHQQQQQLLHRSRDADSRRSLSTCHRRRRHRSQVVRVCACAKRIGCLRSALLVSFVLILLGVIVTSSYAIDRRFSQIPQLLYAGLGLCSIGLFIIVISVSALVTRQLGKQQHHQHHHQHHQQHPLHHHHSSTPSLVPATRRSGRARQSQVPIWYIGCNRDTATAYCPPVPPSYWDSAADPVRLQQSSLPPPPPPKAPPPSLRHQRPQPPLPPTPPHPPSYQEALRCLNDSASARGGGGSRLNLHRQPPLIASASSSSNNAMGSCDQMSVLKWTVQSQHRRHFQQQQQHQHATVRRCESSSFIGEPILV